MADDTFPAAPVKTGPASATPKETATAPAPKAEKVQPAEPVRKSGKSKSPKKSAKTMIKDEASKLSKQAGQKARVYAKDGKDRASGAIDELAKLLDDTAGSVDSHMGEQYGKYARSAAGQVSGFADTLRSRDVEDLLDDTRAFVRKNPAVAIGAAAAVGFLLARVLKAGIDQAGDGFDDDDLD